MTRNFKYLGNLVVVLAVGAMVAPTATAVPNPAPSTNQSASNFTLGGELYNQNLVGTRYVPSIRKYFDAGATIEDIRPADDFIVPVDHKWRISRLTVPGTWFTTGYTQPTTTTFQITIYSDLNGIPGKMIFSRAVVDRDAIQSLNSYEVTSHETQLYLASPISLNPGRYWLSVQANFGADSEYEWKWKIGNSSNPLVGYQQVISTYSGPSNSMSIKFVPYVAGPNYLNMNFVLYGAEFDLNAQCPTSLILGACVSRN